MVVSFLWFGIRSVGRTPIDVRTMHPSQIASRAFLLHISLGA